MHNVRYFPHNLRFKFAAGTSRGVLHDKKSWFIIVEQSGRQGIGEAGPLPGLSPDDRPDFEIQLKEICTKLQQMPLPATEEEALALAEQLCGYQLPSIRFALETALLDWLHGGRRMIFRNDFYAGKKSIPINGLIWMGGLEEMRQRMHEKLEAGYSCLKMKIGALNFADECRILAEVRRHYSAKELVLRVDANGAFSPAEAMQKLEKLAQYDIHSIEQPIKAGQAREMHRLCRESPVPVALDEELIGQPPHVQEELLKAIAPPYIILKPGLLGGIAASRQWIRMAEEQGIRWWITSALESNIGLNAISQFTAEYGVSIPQGLGTGQLYHNNVPSPLRINKGALAYRQDQPWDLEIFEQ